MATPVKAAVVQVRPLLSVNSKDAHRRVLNLYRAWFQQVQFITQKYHIPKSEKELKSAIRAEFMKHANVTDLRVIDKLLIKGQLELQEVAEQWKTNSSIMFFFKDTVEKKPTDFMSKFLSGQD